MARRHTEHLLQILEEHYEIAADWEGKKFAGIDLEWNYVAKHCDRTCRLSMKGYIDTLLIKYGHPRPKKPQLSPHKHREINYGAKDQLTPEEDTTPALDEAGTKRIQGIVGASQN